MNDIEERLRMYRPTRAICLAAADEIARLKAACRDQAGVELSEENDRLIAELTRLRAELEDLRQQRREQIAQDNATAIGRVRQRIAEAKVKAKKED